MVRLSSVLVLAGAVAACSALTAPSVPFRHIGSGWYSTLAQPQVKVVRDAADWAAVRQQLQFAAHDAPRAIDFAAEAAAVVALGTRQTSGYAVQVEAVRNRDGEHEVIALELTPGPCATAQVLTSPFEVITIPRDVETITVTWSPRARTSCS